MTGRGKFLLTLLVLGVLGVGVWQWMETLEKAPVAPGAAPATGPASSGVPAPGPQPAPPGPAAAARAPLDAKELVAPEPAVPDLPAPAAYQMKGNVVEIELSDYPGYAGLIAANGGLEPNPNSVFARNHGFQVRIALSEEESWPALNTGKMAASATTVDVLAVYGKQFDVVVPAQIGYSRGADAIVVRSDVKSFNALKGKTLATVQFTEAEFFARYAAQTAGMPVHALADLSSRPDPESLNLVFCEESPHAAELFVRHAKADHPALAGFVGWAPSTTEAIEAAGGRAHVLQSNANLLIVADVLIVNRGFAQQKPEVVAGLVAGMLEGNRMVRENREAHLDVLGKAFGSHRDETRKLLDMVHFSNGPENLAFFSGEITSAGSFEGIFQSAIYSYGRTLIRNPTDASRFAEVKHLQALEKAGAFKDQAVAIAPTRAKAMSVEIPFLSKNVNFLFERESATLDMKDEGNLRVLKEVQSMIQVSPGSSLVLRGHVDNSQIEAIRRQGGEELLRKATLQADELSKKRANEIKRVLVDGYAVDAARLTAVGCGWNEPLGTDPDKNRRVEVQWFTLE